MSDAQTAHNDTTANASIACETSPAVIERALGLTAALALTFFCTHALGVHLADIARPVPAAFVLSLVLGGLLLSHGPHRVAQLFGVIFGRAVHSNKDAESLRSLCQRGRRLAYAGAMLQIVMSTVGILQALGAPAVMGSGIGDALCALVFGTLLAELGFGAALHWVTPKP